MKPAQFDYEAPRTLAEAVALRARYGTEASLLAGGQSLVPLLNMRLARPARIIDLNRVDELDYLRQNGEGLEIGALTRHSTVAEDSRVSAASPLLAEAAGLIGHIAIRNRGTIGGNLAHADPASEYGAVLLVLDGAVVATGPGGTRTIPAAELFLTYLTTTLEPDEILTAVRVPVLPAGAGWAMMELVRRHGDYALVGCAAMVEPGPEDTLAEVRLGLIGVGPTAVRPLEAEALLRGQRPTPEVLAAAGEAAAAAVEPESDVHATAEYRRAMVPVYVERAITRALSRARGGAS